MIKTKWTTISLPSEMLNELDEFAKTHDAKKYGLTSKSQIIALLVRKFLNKGIELLSDSNDLQNKDIEKLEKELTVVQEQLKKYDKLLTHEDILNSMHNEGSIETTALHGENGRELLNKIDPPNTPKKITVYHTTDKEKALKDNHIEGIVIVKIFRKKLKCTYHEKDNSCIHIKYTLKNDERFRRTAYVQGVENPILKQLTP